MCYLELRLTATGVRQAILAWVVSRDLVRVDPLDVALFSIRRCRGVARVVVLRLLVLLLMATRLRLVGRLMFYRFS